MKRAFLNIAVVLAAMLLIVSNVHAQRYVRKNAHAAAASVDLKSLELAMDYMKKKLPCDSPRSWYYQGAMHDAPNLVNGNNKYCSSYKNASNKKIGWKQCPHDPSATYHFLIWHRLYIWHFEQIVRAISKNKNFALPYWDYTDPSFRTMPPQFINQNSSLYTAARVKSLNAGNPISNDISLDTVSSFRHRIFGDFSNSLDSDIHGVVHYYTGGGLETPQVSIYNEIEQQNSLGLMAKVPTAGFDPVFWIHHSNIDYLWTRWERLTGVKPDLKQLKRFNWDYTFFKPDGKKITYSVEEAYNKAMNLDYDYEGIISKPPSTFTVTASSRPNNLLELSLDPLQEPRTISILDQKVGKKMTDNVMNVELSLAKEHKDKAKNNLFESTSSQQSNLVGRMILTVTVEFDKEPTAIYEVYFNSNRVDKAKKAGKLSFFGAMHSHEGMNHPMTISKEFRFDVTEEYATGDVGEKPNVFLNLAAGAEQNFITIKSIKLDVVRK